MFKTKMDCTAEKDLAVLKQLVIFIYSKLDKKTKQAVSTSTQWGYGIHDYKTGKLFLIE